MSAPGHRPGLRRNTAHPSSHGRRPWRRLAVARGATRATHAGAAHLHVLVVDGVFHCTDDGASPRFVETPAPTRGELRAVLERVHARVLATLEARRVGERSDMTDDAMVYTSRDRDHSVRSASWSAILALRAHARQQTVRALRFATVPAEDARAWDAAHELRPGLDRRFPGLRPAALRRSGRCGRHVPNRAEPGRSSAGRGRCEPMRRESGERILPAGSSKMCRSDRAEARGEGGRAAKTHRIMTPVEFIARLAALVPPPRHPLVRYHGVLAPNSPWRVAVVPWPAPAAPVAPAAIASTRVEAAGLAKPSSHRIDWATLLRRVWDLDVLRCPACDGRMRMIAAIEDRTAIVKILEHLGVPTELPRMTRSRDGPWA